MKIILASQSPRRKELLERMGISRFEVIHYEITEGGARVNPLNYLPGYIKSW